MTSALIAVSVALIPKLQVALEPSFTPEQLSALRSVLVGVGASLIGATAITFSVVMLAVQLNFARIPFGLFRRLSADPPLLASFAATFVLGVTIALVSLLPDASWVAPAVVLSGWCALATLSLFLIAYRRALNLISPTKQLELVLQKADRSMRRWAKWADRSAPLLERKPNPENKRNMARAMFFRMHPHWERDAREATSHILAFARRYAEQGEYDVSSTALTSLLSINVGYIAARGRTFFPTNPLFTNPLSAESFISDTLEQLRRLAISAQGRSDEEQLIQVMAAMTRLCEVYAAIDYGKDFNIELHHSQLAAGYLTGAIRDATRTFGPDVLMEGVRLAGKAALVMVQARHAVGAITIAQSISSVALVGLVKPGYEPVTSTAVQQLAMLAFELLRSAEHDIGFASREVRTSILIVTRAALTTDDGGTLRKHSGHLKAYYALTDLETFADRLTKLVNAVLDRPTGDDDAERILDHLEDWSDGIFKGEKEILLAAVEKRSFLTFDLIGWICQVTRVLVAGSSAPAASEHVRRKLTENAAWLICVLDWFPDDKESITFVETFDVIEHLFRIALDMHVWGADEVAIAARDVLLRWAFKAGKHKTGWATLERALTALSILSVWKADSGWMAWLTTEVGDRLNKVQVESDIRERTARELRKNSGMPRRGDFALSAMDQALARVDQQQFSTAMNAIADLIAPEAGKTT